MHLAGSEPCQASKASLSKIGTPGIGTSLSEIGTPEIGTACLLSHHRKTRMVFKGTLLLASLTSSERLYLKYPRNHAATLVH
jgi:hypothetical protein